MHSERYLQSGERIKEEIRRKWTKQYNTLLTYCDTSASSRWPLFHMISIACRFYSIAAFLWVLFPLNSNFISSLCLSTGTMTSSQLGNLNGAFNLSHFCHVSIFIPFDFISLFEAHNKRSEETRQFMHAFVDSRSLYGSHPCIVKFQGRLVERQRQRPSQNAEINFFPIFSSAFTTTDENRDASLPTKRWGQDLFWIR